MPLQLIVGEVAFKTLLFGTYVTAVGGGGQTTNALHTDATQAQAWEKFKLWVDQSVATRPATHKHTYAFQTATGNYLTAVNGGGLGGINVLHTDATHPQAWEKFRLVPIIPPVSFTPVGGSGRIPAWYYAIQTERGDFLTAVDGGDRTIEPTMQSNSTQIHAFELFQMVSFGELMSGYQYGFQPVIQGGWMYAVNGGDRSNNGLATQRIAGEVTEQQADEKNRTYAKFRILPRQTDGSFALQTLSQNYVTAVSGGGVAPVSLDGLTSPGDAFHTNAAHIQILKNSIYSNRATGRMSSRLSLGTTWELTSRSSGT